VFPIHFPEHQKVYTRPVNQTESQQLLKYLFYLWKTMLIETGKPVNWGGFGKNSTYYFIASQSCPVALNTSMAHLIH
jgi:hypothetical protein